MTRLRSRPTRMFRSPATEGRAVLARDPLGRPSVLEGRPDDPGLVEAALVQEWSRARIALRVRVQRADAHLPSAGARRLTHDLVLAPGLAITGGLVNVQPESLAAWPVDEGEMLEKGLSNLAGETKNLRSGRVELAAPPGRWDGLRVTLTCVEGKAASHTGRALFLDALLKEPAPYGRLVAVPNRLVVWTHVVVDDSAEAAAEAMAMLAADDHRTGLGSLSPDVYWAPPGRTSLDPGWESVHSPRSGRCSRRSHRRAEMPVPKVRSKPRVAGPRPARRGHHPATPEETFQYLMWKRNESWEVAREHLCLRIQRRDLPNRGPVGRRLSEDLDLTLGVFVDVDPSSTALVDVVGNVMPEWVARWPVHEEELWELAKQGSPLSLTDLSAQEGGYRPETGPWAGHDVALRMIDGPAAEHAMRALIVAPVMARPAPFGFLVAIPNEEQVLTHTIVDDRVGCAIEGMRAQAAIDHRWGHQPLSAEVYWAPPGQPLLDPAWQSLETRAFREMAAALPPPAPVVP